MIHLLEKLFILLGRSVTVTVSMMVSMAMSVVTVSVHFCKVEMLFKKHL